MNGRASHRAYYPQFRSLLTWPQEVFRLLLYIPLVTTLAVVAVSYITESRYQRYSEATKARIHELQAAKLAGVGTYYWKSLLQCDGIRRDLGTAADCLPLKFKIVPSQNFAGRLGRAQQAEAISGPCLLCHREARDSLVVYEFEQSAPFRLPLVTAAMIAVVLAFFWYAAWGWFAWQRKAFLKQPLVALAIVSGRAFTPEWQATRLLLRKTPGLRSLYSEWGGNYIRSVMTVAQFEHWLRYFCGTESPFPPAIPDSNLKVAAYLAPHPGGLPIPFESLRRAHLMAHRGLTGSLLVQKQLLDSMTSSGIPRSRRKAFWKTRQGQITEFSILTLLRNAATQEDWSITHA